MPLPPTPVCLVTGGSSGIGLETARKFHREGYRVALCGLRAERVERAHRELSAGDPDNALDHCIAQSVDVANSSALKAFLDLVLNRWERIDVLVNNAGTAHLAAVDQLRPEEFRKTIEINIEAVFHAVSAVWPVMLKQQHGTIVNVSSMAALDPFPGFSVYGATKAWVNTYTHAIAAEGRPHGIHAFAVCPGFVQTELKQRLFPDSPPEIALHPSQVADAIFQLSLPQMRIASGESIRLLK